MLHVCMTQQERDMVELEKPFGSDLALAKLLASEISKYLREGEIYRVDHYLGKFGVEQILSAILTGEQWLANSSLEQREHIMSMLKLP